MRTACAKDGLVHVRVWGRLHARPSRGRRRRRRQDSRPPSTPERRFFEPVWPQVAPFARRRGQRQGRHAPRGGLREVSNKDVLILVRKTGPVSTR